MEKSIFKWILLKAVTVRVHYLEMVSFSLRQADRLTVVIKRQNISCSKDAGENSKWLTRENVGGLRDQKKAKYTFLSLTIRN